MNLPGTPITADDHRRIFAPRWVDPETAERALLCRVDTVTGGELVGRNGAGKYEGIAIPYFLPGESSHREVRLRRDHPDMEYRNGKLKEQGKYLFPPGSRNIAYFIPGAPGALLQTVDLPVIVAEGEFKTLALWRLANHEVDTPRFVPIGFGGVWNWKGTIGKTNGPDGDRRGLTGPIPDLDRVSWKGRNVIIAFDADVKQNDQVRIARASLAKELRRRSAKVAFLEWDISTGKGIDDHLAAVGREIVLDEIAAVDFKDWKANLIRSNKNDWPRALFANAVTAFREAPDFNELLAYNDFSTGITCSRPTPWGSSVTEWTDQEDRLAANWLQHQGIFVSIDVAGQAVQAVSKDRSFHPVKTYLDALEWDGIKRLDIWLNLYLGVESNDYVAAVGSRWLISAVARVYRPGCKADCCLILEGPQGIKKSTSLRGLGDPWFTDEIADLGSKDAAMQTRGAWIIEIAELDSMSKGEVGKIKAFMSRGTDRLRPPYGKRVIESPRQCVFAGSVNHSTYLRDATGGRRFWPVTCGQIKIQELNRDRDQLWAEAVVRYRAGETWWLNTPELNHQAEQEQADRYEGDPWDQTIFEWLLGRESVSIPQVLESCLDKPKSAWTQSDMNRVSQSIRSLGWVRYRYGPKSNRKWRYKPGFVSQSSLGSQSASQFETESGTPDVP
jgi:predicted P-loop ATPase